MIVLSGKIVISEKSDVEDHWEAELRGELKLSYSLNTVSKGTLIVKFFFATNLLMSTSISSSKSSGKSDSTHLSILSENLNFGDGSSLHILQRESSRHL